MQNRFYLIGLSLSLLLTLFPATSTAQQVYRVGTTENSSVFEFEYITKETGIEFEYHTYSRGSETRQAVLDGDIDFAANAAYSLERDALFDFSEPIFPPRVYLFSSDSSSKLPTLKKVGVQRGTIYEYLLEKSFSDEFEIVEFEHMTDAVVLILNKEVDGVVGGFNLTKTMLLNGIYPTQLYGELLLPFPHIIAKKGRYKNELDLFSRIVVTTEGQNWISNQIKKKQHKMVMDIIDLLKNGKSLDRINVMVLDNTDVAIDQFNKAILLEACEILEVICDNKFSGYNYQDEKGNQALNHDEVDLIAGLLVQEGNKDKILYSDPYLSINSIILQNKNNKGYYQSITEMIAEKIGVVSDDPVIKVVDKLSPNKSLVHFDTRKAMYDALEKNEIDFALTYDEYWYDYLYNNPATLVTKTKYIVGALKEWEIALGFKHTQKGNELARLFNLALMTVDYEHLLMKHYNGLDMQEILKSQYYFSRNVYFISVVVIFIIILFAYKAHHASLIDELTRLKNRRALYEQNRGALKNKSVLYCDLNAFKAVNDTYGHGVGDQVLIEFSQLLKGLPNASNYRVGGDEFVTIIDLDDYESINEIAESIAKFEFFFEGKKLDVSVAIGVGLVLKPYLLDEITVQVDTAMYKAKEEKHSGSCIEIIKLD